MKPVVLLIAALATSNCLLRASLKSFPLADGCTDTPDVAYYDGKGFDDSKNRLDVYAPRGPGPHPVLVFVHGGGWIFGDRRQAGGSYPKLGHRLAAQGIVTMVISYRLAPFNRHPAQVSDVAHAVHWAHEHAADYGGDPAALFVMGHSAGAHLAALTATDPRWLKEAGGSTDEIAGVIGISGPYDVEHLGKSLFLGGLPMIIPTFGRDHAVWRDVMPENHLHDGHVPPFFLAWGDGDFLPVRRDGPRFEEALVNANVPVQSFETYADDHFSIITDFGDDDSKLTAKVIDFMFQQATSLRRRASR